MHKQNLSKGWGLLPNPMSRFQQEKREEERQMFWATAFMFAGLLLALIY